MRILFVHNNYPAQFQPITEYLRDQGAHDLRVIASNSAPPTDLPSIRYTLPAVALTDAHPFARRFEIECHRAEQVLYAAAALRSDGFSPDVVLAHSGWGEALPLRSVFPTARIVSYCEFYYRPYGQDVNFDDEFEHFGLDRMVGLHIKNAATTLSLAQSDAGLAPTHWQRSTFPPELQSKISVVHEGVRTDLLRPDPRASLVHNGTAFQSGEEIVTFVSRCIEPLRGAHVFLRALSRILAERPSARVVIVGGTDKPYGAHPEDGRTWKEIFWDEVKGDLDETRVHFMGPVSHPTYVKLLQVSAVHVYLTYPFVLSWSLIEAMSLGCFIVASDTAPVQEVVKSGEHGVLVPFFDADALSDAIIEGLANRDGTLAMRRRARQTAVRRFDARAVTTPKLAALLGVT